MENVRVLFVCMGNICRSPLAEGFARAAAAAAGLPSTFDSADTEDYHVGAAPDPRACEIAAQHGVDIRTLRARQVDARDFTRFDVILAADRRNLAALLRRRPPDATADLGLLLEWCGEPPGSELPDPYYGGPAEFSHVADCLQRVMPRLLKRLEETP